MAGKELATDIGALRTSLSPCGLDRGVSGGSAAPVETATFCEINFCFNIVDTSLAFGGLTLSGATEPGTTNGFAFSVALSTDVPLFTGSDRRLQTNNNLLTLQSTGKVYQ